MIKYLYIASGGALGCMLRYLSASFISGRTDSPFPYGTFFVNLAGSLVIGLLFGIFSVNGEVDERMKFLFFIGFLGGFTTFSSFAFENMRLLSTGLFGTAALYIVLSNVIGIALVFAGYFLGTRIK